MINITGTRIFNDRWVLNVTKIEPNSNDSFSPTGTDYVLLRNASYSEDYVSFENIYGAFCVNKDYRIECGPDSSAAIISFPGLWLFESRYYVQDELDIGNLSYMDGGSNTTAVNPGRLGDPVVNYVHFPPNMHQTLHTHPSHRIGLILKGNGKIELDNNEFFEVKEGDVFYMRRYTLHNFITCREPVIMFVFAPDSGTGPTDEVNPLKIRTYVGQQRYAK
jgi:quercetin dioxygenase-like cupin family protein